MSKLSASVNFKEEVRSSLWLVILVCIVLGYLIYGEQKKRRIPVDFDTIEQNIITTEKKIVGLINGEDLPELVRSLNEIQVLAKGFGVNVKLDDYKMHRKETARGKIGDLEYARSQRWSGEITGKTKDVLVFARMSQQLVPIEFNSLRINGGGANAIFSIVGS